MNVIVKKWGNSLGVRIPKIIADNLHIKDGVAVEIKDINGQIIISPKRFTLESLLEKIDETTIHRETDTGSSVGNESW